MLDEDSESESDDDQLDIDALMPAAPARQPERTAKAKAPSKGRDQRDLIEKMASDLMHQTIDAETQPVEGDSVLQQLLQVDAKLLNPEAEVRKRFGSGAVSCSAPSHMEVS